MREINGVGDDCGFGADGAAGEGVGRRWWHWRLLRREKRASDGRVRVWGTLGAVSREMADEGGGGMGAVARSAVWIAVGLSVGMG